MQIDTEKLAEILRPGDQLTTTLGREFIVGALHADGWIEPEGAGDYDWWIPLSKVATVNGVPVPTIAD